MKIITFIDCQNYFFLTLINQFGQQTDILTYELSVIGNIVPGIMAYWMEEQGMLRTMSVMWTNAVLTCLLVMLIFGRLFSL